MDIQSVLPVFFEESREMLAEMEALLLSAPQGMEPGEDLNAIFRVAHTLKGNAGLFGFPAIVAFAHEVEALLVRARNGAYCIDAATIELLLKSKDHLEHLLDRSASGEALSAGEQAEEQQLLARFAALTANPQPLAQRPAAMNRPNNAVLYGSVEASGGGPVETDNWHISVRFGPNTFRNCMDPLTLLHYLTTFGDIVGMVVVFDGLPDAATIDPESCYLGFEIGFKTEVDKAMIESAFEFVREESHLTILPPKSKLEQYIQLILNEAEQPQRLGDILLACHSLTPSELKIALRQQQASGPQSARLGEILLQNQFVQAPLVQAALQRQNRQQTAGERQDSRYIRVEAEKLDGLINLVGELVIAGVGAQMLAHGERNRDLQDATALVGSLVEEVRKQTLQLRLVEIGHTFERFRRLVHDVSQELGKPIDLIIEGGDTELDKALTEKIVDPLTHLIRNAMDHGIEPAQQRTAQGKPAQGTLRLKAYHVSGSVFIQIADDGGGLNRERIRAKALAQGLINEAQVLTDAEIRNLIFVPGFSTAAQVSNLSGRGVGMDVVKRNVSALRGSIQLDSEEGRGTTVTLQLPLTLAIIDGFLVKIGNATYVIPLDAVSECIEAAADAEVLSQDCGYINLRGQVLPFLRLREQFGFGGKRPLRENVVVVRQGTQRIGLVVDRLLGEFQTVIKPLCKIFTHTIGISGSTILGTGEVALILDIAALINNATSQHTPLLQNQRPANTAASQTI